MDELGYLHPAVVAVVRPPLQANRGHFAKNPYKPVVNGRGAGETVVCKPIYTLRSFNYCKDEFSGRL
jgi:hypothetical protein